MLSDRFVELDRLVDEALEACEHTKFLEVVACIRAGMNPPQYLIDAEPLTIDYLARSVDIRPGTP